MKNKNLFISCIILFLSMLCACKSMDTHVTISHKKLPAHFGEATDTASAATLNWRSYFADSILCALLDTVLTSNPDLHISLQKLEIARAGAKAAKADLFPRVGLNVNGGMRRYGLYTMDGAGNISTEILPGKIVPVDLPDYYAGIQASWEADIWGKLRNKRRMAQASYLASVEGVNFVITSLIADVAMAYYELVALDHELSIIRQTIQKQEEALDVVQAHKEAGKSNQLAVQQFHAQLLHSKTLKKFTQQQIIEAENRINFLAGRFPQPVARHQQFSVGKTADHILAGVPSQLLNNRPDIRAAALEVEAEKFNVRAVRAEFLPAFTITSGLGYQAFKLEYLFESPASIAYSAIGSLTAPLINRKAIQARFQSAKASQVAAMYAYQKTILGGYAEVANELSNMQNLREINALKQEQTTLLLDAVETSSALFESGKATYLEVLMTQQNALQASLELVDAHKRLSLATVTLYKALGGGWR